MTAADQKPFDRAAAVVRAHDLLVAVGPGWPGRDELCDILRSLIAGLSPDEADAALVELFREIDICDDVIMESYGFVRDPGEES